MKQAKSSFTILPTSTTAPSFLASPTQTETLSPFLRLLATTPLTFPNNHSNFLNSYLFNR